MPNNYNFPVDAVYTWVNGSDPRWQHKKNLALNRINNNAEVALNDHECSDGRFSDNDELRYSLRSIELYAPWIRKVHLVTDNQRPEWINPDRVHIVDHKDIFPDYANLPSFNSHSIELCLHRIEGLAEHFLYFNDDFLLGRGTCKKDFFSESGIPLLWVIKRSKKYIQKILSEDYCNLTPHKAGEARARHLVFELFNHHLPYTVRHYPRAMRRSLAFELWEQYSQEVRNTLSHQFRSIDDVAIHILYPLHAIASGKGTPRVINGIWQFIDILKFRPLHLGASISDTNCRRKMRQIQLSRPLTYCLNDGAEATKNDRAFLCCFLQKMLLEKSSFEL